MTVELCRCCGQVTNTPTIEEIVEDALRKQSVKAAQKRPALRQSDAERFLARLAIEGGAIVSTGTLTPVQIADAHVHGRLLVLADGLGFVVQPPTEEPK